MWRNGLRMEDSMHEITEIEDYTLRDGVIHSPMRNVVIMLTPTHSGAGCFAVLPGSRRARGREGARLTEAAIAARSSQ